MRVVVHCFVSFCIWWVRCVLLIFLVVMHMIVLSLVIVFRMFGNFDWLIVDVIMCV